MGSWIPVMICND